MISSMEWPSGYSDAVKKFGFKEGLNKLNMLTANNSRASRAREKLIDELFEHHISVDDKYTEVAKHLVGDNLVRSFEGAQYDPAKNILKVSWKESLDPDGYWLDRVVVQTMEEIKNMNFGDVSAHLLKNLKNDFYEDNQIIFGLGVMYDYSVDLEDHKKYVELAKLRK